MEESLVTPEGKVDVILLLGIPEELTATVEAELLQLYDRLFTIAGDERLRNELRKQRDVLAVKEWMQRKGLSYEFYLRIRALFNSLLRSDSYGNETD